MRLTSTFILMLLSSVCLGQETHNKYFAYSEQPTSKVKQTGAVADDEGYYLSLDSVNKKLIIPPCNDSMDVYGIKIFSDQGNELFSRRIANPTKHTAIDISNLKTGNYILHLVTADMAIYRSKFAFKK